MTEYSVEKFYNEYAIKQEDTIIAVLDSGTNARKVCDLLNEQEERIIELEKENVKLRNDFFEKQILEEHWRRYDRNSNGYTGETTDDIRFSTEEDKIFEERTRKALERVEKSDRKPLSSKDVFLDELKNW